MIPPCQGYTRPARARFGETAPAILRLKNGRCVSGKLHVVSITGGLLRLSRPVDQGSHVKMKFVTHAGSVWGIAEMLRPGSGNFQPFRFLALPPDDHRTLQAAIQSFVDPRGPSRIEKYRAW